MFLSSTFYAASVFVYPIVLVNMNFKFYIKRISLALSHLSSNSPFFVSSLKLKRAKDKRGALFCDQATLTKEKEKRTKKNTGYRGSKLLLVIFKNIFVYKRWLQLFPLSGPTSSGRP